MKELFVPSRRDELFGPHVGEFLRFKPERAFLLAMSREVKGRAGSFFDDTRRTLISTLEGLNGFGLDVLRLYPFPLATAAEDLPEEILAEDLFSVGFTEMGTHGVRAETYGLARLGQRELTFTFDTPALMEEAALFCGHLAEWALEHGRTVNHGQSLAFGFDQITFAAAEGEAGGPFRGWHPPIIQRLLPESLFPGVGVLEVFGGSELKAGAANLTAPLNRSLDQRVILEEHDLTGDSPHRTQTAQLRGFLSEMQNIVAWREEPRASKDSGWHVQSGGDTDSGDAGVISLADLARKIPHIVRFLAMPPGVRLEWDAEGRLHLDTARAHQIEEEELGDDPDEELA
jgi:hypothetical protein